MHADVTLWTMKASGHLDASFEPFSSGSLINGRNRFGSCILCLSLLAQRSRFTCTHPSLSHSGHASVIRDLCTVYGPALTPDRPLNFPTQVRPYAADFMHALRGCTSPSMGGEIKQI